MRSISRRGLIQVTAALAFTGSKSGTAAPAPVQDQAIEWLEQRRAELVAECERLERLWLGARARMPAHFLPGLKYMTEDGKPEGPRVGWPDAQRDSIRLSSGMMLVRPSPYDLRELFEIDNKESGRDIAIANYRIRVQQLRRRRGERRQHERTLGMPQTSNWLPLDIEIESIDVMLEQSLPDYTFVTTSVDRGIDGDVDAPGNGFKIPSTEGRYSPK
jgi:hypothetical protein